MSNTKDKENLQILEDKDVEQVSGGAVSGKKYKGPTPGLDHPIGVAYGAERPHEVSKITVLKYGMSKPKVVRPVDMAYGMPDLKQVDPELFSQPKMGEKGSEE